MFIDDSDRGNPVPTPTELAPRRTESPLHPAVRTAVEIMRSRYAEPITLNDLSAEVYVSPFHFSRMFAKATGATPGRFLTAVRTFEAKRLLLTTSMTVSDIVCSVGYSSVGTFTSRFSRAVGMSPSQYRSAEVRDLMVAVTPDRATMPPAAAMDAAADAHRGSDGLTARVELPSPMGPATLLVGVFDEAIPQRGPATFTCVDGTRSTTVSLDGAPGGPGLVLAIAQHATGDPDRPTITSMGTNRGRVSTGGDGGAVTTLRMRPVPTTMPPIAFTLAAAGAARHPFPVAAAAPSLPVAA